jgi:lipid-binding SYLF domain-containing protein
MRKLMAIVVGIALASALTVQAKDEGNVGLKDKDLKVLNEAPAILTALTEAPDQTIPRNLLEKAECVAVFPNVAKGAFVVGGEFGRGVVTCRTAPGAKMGAPALFTRGGASVGWQLGGQSTDFVLLVMDKNGMDNLLRDEFKIGADASAAAGPVGRSAEAATDVLLGAQLLSWSRSKGLFAGASLEGAVIKPNADANERLYGHPITAQRIFEGNPMVPAAARPFVDLATRVTSGDQAIAESHPQPSKSADYSADTKYSAPSKTVADTTYSKNDHVTGRVVSVSESRLSIDTSSGERSFTLNDSTLKPTQLRAGNEVSVEYDDALVATRIDREGELPRTASPLALYGLAGVLSLLGAAAMRFRARR